MYLKRNKKLKLRTKLIISTTLLLSISLFIVATTIYYLLSDSLRLNDQENLLKITNEYSDHIKRNRLDFYQQNHPKDLLIIVQDNKKGLLFLSEPKVLEDDLEEKKEIKNLILDSKLLPLRDGLDTLLLLSTKDNQDLFPQLESRFFHFAHSMNWPNIMPLMDNDLFEIYTKQVQEDIWIKIGKSSEEREERLSDIRAIGFAVIIPFIFLSIILSYFFSEMILSSLKSLVHTIEKIKNGDNEARAEVIGANDEIDTLSLHFNSLVSHNQKLINGLKSTIDNIAHDLRTPLTRFRMSAENALNNATNKEQLVEALEDGLENSEKMVQLLNAIMDISESEAGTINLNKAQVNIKEILLSVIDLFSYISEEKSIEVKLDTFADFFILADQIRLTQAFANILDNAIKFSPQDSKVEISVEKENEDIIVKVKNSGEGILIEDIPHIWDRLYRADKSRSTQGFGLGLSIVRAIILAHQGNVEVQSSPEMGTIFSLRLPICNETERFS